MAEVDTVEVVIIVEVLLMMVATQVRRLVKNKTDQRTNLCKIVEETTRATIHTIKALG